MADRFPAELQIPLKYLDEEIKNEILEETGVDALPEKEEKHYFDGGEIEIFEKMLYCRMNSANYGRFDIEDILVQKKIPFDRVSDAAYEYPAVRRYYRPDEIDEEVLVTHDEKEEYITRLEVETMRNVSPAEFKEKVLNFFCKVKPIQDYA